MASIDNIKRLIKRNKPLTPSTFYTLNGVLYHVQSVRNIIKKYSDTWGSVMTSVDEYGNEHIHKWEAFEGVKSEHPEIRYSIMSGWHIVEEVTE